MSTKERSIDRYFCTCRKIVVSLMLSLFIPGFLMAQNKTITGIVKDDSGKVVPGATVIIKGTKTGTNANDAGKFTLNAPLKSVLIITAINYSRMEVTVDAKEIYIIVLHPSQGGSSEDVVVMGYGLSVKRKDLTGSAGSVDMKDALKAPVSSLDGFLAGRVAGVSVLSADGQPGSNATINIRGISSINTDGGPLYVVDGFPLDNGNFNSINPDDIESIDVLKDASATALYGARGANGVIVITTKKGKSGAPQLTYNAFYGWNQVPKKMEMMAPYDFVKYIHDLNPAWDSVYLRTGVNIDEYKTAERIDMQELAFRNGQTQDHSLAVRGGNDKTKYSLSGNYNSNNGTIINTAFKRYQGRFVLDQVVTEKLKVGINTNYSYALSSGAGISTPTFYASSTSLYSTWGYRPVNPISGPFEEINIIDEFYDPLNENNAAQDQRVNPLINLKNVFNQLGSTSFVSNAYAEYAFSSKLKLRVTGGINRVGNESKSFNNSRTGGGSKYSSDGINGSVSNRVTSSWNNANTLSYTTTLGASHHLNALASVELNSVKSSYVYFKANQLPNEELGIDGIDQGDPAKTISSSNSTRSTLASGLIRANYDYQGKYFLTGSVRADGSSRFAEGNKWGYFPSGAIAWRLSKEGFMKNVPAISEAKIRFSYGTGGNNRVSDFAYLPQINFDQPNWWNYSTNGQVPVLGAYISSPGNADLKWETNVQSNLGLDLGFFKDRITATIDVYTRITKDLLLNAQLPGANGIFSQTGFKNVGELENKGVELSFTSRNIETKNFGWNTSFNISFNRNKILKLAEGSSALLAGSGTFLNTTFSTLSPYISAIGRPVGEMYGTIFDGVYQYADFDLLPNGSYLLKPSITTNGVSRAAQKPGDIKYRDLNGDLTINTSDYTIIGSGYPKHEGGLSNNFRYKNFDLSIFLQWKYGQDVINANRYVFEGGIVTNPNLNQLASYNGRWTPANPSNTLFRAGGFTNAAYSSRVVEDGSYLKLRTVSVGYGLPANILRKIKMNSLRFNIAAQNILTWTKYSGQDPEVSSRQSTLTPNFDYTGYPHSLSVAFRINAIF